MKAYQQIELVFKRLFNLQHASAILNWDEAAMMPQGGGEARGEAMAELAALMTETLLQEHLQELAGEAAQENLSEWQKANLREMTREIVRVRQVDPTLTERQTRERIRCEQAWRTLRAQNNWREFLPYLKRVVELAREEAEQRSKALNLSRYDALAEQLDPGGREAFYTEAFAPLERELPGLIEQIIEKQKTFDRPRGPFPIEKQKQLGAEIMKILLFDFNHGRLDVSVHPFCGGVPDDVRLTTRYKEEDWTESLMGVIHETGHASYEQSLPAEFRRGPVGTALGMSVHESQSLFFEMQIGRSAEFLRYLSPVASRVFNCAGDPSFSPENLKRLYTKVERGFIRVSADEVTYPCHILLRFKLERLLVSGAIECEDLPHLWDQEMKALLGLSTLGNDKDGVMQDVHWPSGAFGYFPSYTIGAMIAAQLASTMKRQIPDFEACVERGRIEPIHEWLKTHIWCWGRYYSTPELVRRATGETLDPKYFLEHLRSRYLKF